MTSNTFICLVYADTVKPSSLRELILSGVANIIKQSEIFNNVVILVTLDGLIDLRRAVEEIMVHLCVIYIYIFVL